VGDAAEGDEGDEGAERSRMLPRGFTVEGRTKGCIAAATVTRAATARFHAEMGPLVQRLRSSGLSVEQIADYLAEHGHATRRGAEWSGEAVRRILGASKKPAN